MNYSAFSFISIRRRRRLSTIQIADAASSELYRGRKSRDLFIQLYMEVSDNSSVWFILYYCCQPISHVLNV
jgi:hypothetical protein